MGTAGQAAGRIDTVAVADYPVSWEADVVLADGATAHLRPIKRDDAARLVDFYGRVGQRSKYQRFFAPYPVLSDRDVERFTSVDHDRRVALIVLAGDDLIAVGRYDRTGNDTAEVAFLVEDTHQRRGVGSVLLEHLAQAARERGIARFVADVLPANQPMTRVFREAGYRVCGSVEDGVLTLGFDIHPTASSLEVTRAREHRAEARSVQRLLTPWSLAVVSAVRSPNAAQQALQDSAVQAMVAQLVASGFTGWVCAVGGVVDAPFGVPAYASLEEVPGEVDLAVVTAPLPALLDLVPGCARRGVRGLVVVSAGDDGHDADSRARDQELVQLARAHGMRVVGPDSLGVINTAPHVSLNASLAPMPPGGRIGCFAESAALGTLLLAQLRAGGLGLSTFVSAGERADVSGNDLLQYWADDPATDVVALALESLGNPRKFGRIARRLSRSKPLVALRSSRSAGASPIGAGEFRELPPAAVDAVFRQAGVIRVDTVPDLLDVATVLAAQPLPSGRRVAIVGNSAALARLAADTAAEAGLDVVGTPRDLGRRASAAEFAAALAGCIDDPVVDAIVVVHAAAAGSVTPAPQDADAVVAEVVAAAAARAAKPVLSTFAAGPGAPAGWSSGTPERPVRALGHVATYAQWRSRDPGVVPDLSSSAAVDGARRLVDTALAERPGGGTLTGERLRALLGCYGVTALPAEPVATAAAAIAAAERFGGDVVLKATAPHLRQRPDLAAVWRSIGDAATMAQAWSALTATAGRPEVAAYVVQPMAPPGVPVSLAAWDDPAFGPVMSFGLAGVAGELLGDLAYRTPPLTDRDAADMVREVRAAPLLFGYRGGARADVGALEVLLLRLSRLVDDLPQVAECSLDPVLAAPAGLSVLGAAVRLAPPPLRAGDYARRMGGA